MNLIRNLGDFLSRLGIASVHCGSAIRAGDSPGGAVHDNIGGAFMPGGLGRRPPFPFGFLGITHGQGNAPGRKLCRGMQALHSAAACESL